MAKTLISNFEKIYLEVYLIGYPNEGESILFLIRTSGVENRIIYSGVIDSFEVDNVNQTQNLMDYFSLEQVDFLCWTHPDDDHSIGIDAILDKYATKNTRIVYPYALLEIKQHLKEDAQKLCDSFHNTIMRKKDKNRYKLFGAQSGSLLHSLEIVNYSGETYRLEISALTPAVSIVSSQCDNKALDTNSLSVMLMINFAGINVLLTADVENRTLRFLSEEIELPPMLHYVKIPHHGSTGSDELLNMFGEVNLTELACTTVYKKSKLPKQAILDKYGGIANAVYCTSEAILEGNSAVGIIGVQFDIKDESYNVKLSDNVASF